MKYLLRLLTLALLWMTLGLVGVAQIATFCRPVSSGDSIDRVRLLAVYKMTYYMNPPDTTLKVVDEVWLEVGERLAKQYSGIMHDLDLKAEDSDSPINFNSQDYLLPIVLYTGYPKSGRLTLDYRLPLSAPVMRYSEAIPQIDWTLGTERRTIAGMECQMATCHFGGREWTAWFAPKLAYPYGPYKLGGLPGLILDLYDEGEEYRYTCIGFRPQQEGRAILEWKWDQQQTSRSDLSRLVRSLYATPEAAIKALGVGNVSFGGDAMVDLPYNPIEK